MNESPRQGLRDDKRETPTTSWIHNSSSCDYGVSERNRDSHCDTKITNAMREYRANIAMRNIADTLNRTKMQAISENKRSAMLIDTASNRAAMAVLKYDTPTAAWVVDQTYYVSLPQGVTFQRPTITAPTGVTTTGLRPFRRSPAQRLFSGRILILADFQS